MPLSTLRLSPSRVERWQMYAPAPNAPKRMGYESFSIMGRWRIQSNWSRWSKSQRSGWLKKAEQRWASVWVNSIPKETPNKSQLWWLMTATAFQHLESLCPFMGVDAGDLD